MTEATKLISKTSAELFDEIRKEEPLFILDVRNEEDFADWKIEGKKVTTINIPYFDLIDSVDVALDKLPSGDTPVLVVCAKEGSSRYVVEQLDVVGRKNVSYLEGGMKAWSEYLEPIKIGDLSSGGAIYQFVRIGKGCLSYMIASGGEAAVVDSARMIDVYGHFAKEHGLKIKHTIDTHLHADHISGGRHLAKKTDATYWLPAKDATEAQYEYEPLKDGKEISIGTTKVRILPIYSPGHTIGSTSLIIDDKYLLSGDILFVKSIGRPDLAGKAGDWAGDLRNTLYNVYQELSSNLVLLPAHFADYDELKSDGSVSARLGTLYEKNAGLLVDDESEFRKLVTENLPPLPHSYQEIRLTNMGKLNPDEEKQREMEIGPNRCAVHG